MVQDTRYSTVIERVDAVQRQLECLKRDLISSLAAPPPTRTPKRSLFGTVRGGDVTEQRVEEAKRSLFRGEKDW